MNLCVIGTVCATTRFYWPFYAVHSLKAKVKVHGLHIVYSVLCHFCMQFENKATTIRVVVCCG